MTDLATPPPRSLFRRDAVFEGVNYVPHAAQAKIHRSTARMKAVAAGRRTGKSESGGHELTVEALFTHGQYAMLTSKGYRREFWIVGPEYSDSEKEFRVVYNDLERLQVPFDKPGTYNNPQNQDMHISLWNGYFQIHAKSAKHPETLVGEGLHGVIMAEAAKLKERVWTKFIRPTLADYRGWALLTSTPEGKNWFYRMYQRGNDPDDEQWASWRLPSWVNPHVFPDGATDEGIEMLLKMMAPETHEDRAITVRDILDAGVDQEIIDMAVDMTVEKFKQEIGADFTEFVGKVFKEWDEEIHVANLEYDPRYPVYACCDYGWTHPFVWLFIQVDPFDRINVLREYRTARTDMEDIARALNQDPLTRQVKTFYPDPASPGDTAILEKHLKIPANVETGGELKHRLEAIRKSLRVSPSHGKPEYQRPQLMVDRSCKGLPLGDGGLIREMDEYRYPDTPEESNRMPSEKPMDKDDHGPEALGRFFKGHYGGPLDKPTGRTRVRSAR